MQRLFLIVLTIAVSVCCFLPQTAAAAVDHKMLVILVNFLDNKATPFSTTTIYKSIFGTSTVTDPYFPNPPSPSMDQYYRENSFGALSFSGKVIGWYTVNANSTDCNQMMGTSTWQAYTKAQANGENIAQYNNIMFIFNRSGCSAAGIGTVGSPGSLSQGTTWIFGYNSPRLFAHEIGHNLGNRHSNTFTCNPPPIAPYASCATTAYGDTSDVMGNWDYSHYNAPHEVAMSWIPPADVMTITTTSTTTINSLESPSGTRIVKIPKADNTGDSYYLSMREGLGFNALIPSQYLGGLNIHLWNGSPWYETQLLKFSGTTLKDGGTFTDTPNGISIKQISHTPSTITFATTFFPFCTRKPPTVTPVPTSFTAAAGSSVTYNIIVKNNDTSICSTTTFLVNKIFPTGWGNSSTTALTIAPNASATTTMVVTSPLKATKGTYFLNAVVSGYSTTMTYVVNNAACIRTKPTVTVTPSSTTTRAGTGAPFSVTITNNDSSLCPPTNFTLSETPPSGWTSSPSMYVLLNPVSSKTASISVTSSASASAGTFTIPVLLDDTTISNHSNTANIANTISTMSCARAVPLLQIVPNSFSSIPGAQAPYSVSVTNRDASICGPSTFTFAASAPAGWNKSISPASVTIAPGVTQFATLSVTSPTSASVGTYSVGANTSDATVGTHSASVPASYTVTSPPPPTVNPGVSQGSLSISAKRVKQGGSSILTWWVSSGINPGVTCSVSPASLIQGAPPSVVGSASVTSWGSQSSPITATTRPITTPTRFTLSCSGAAGVQAAQSAIVNFAPKVQEI